MKHIFTTGTFNLMHPGHCHFLKVARFMGDSLTVFLDDDKRNENLKPNKCFFTWKERAQILDSNVNVTEIREFSKWENIEIWICEKIKYDQERPKFLFVKGSDYSMEDIDPELREILSKRSIPTVFISNLEGYSTTDLVQRIVPQKYGMGALSPRENFGENVYCSEVGAFIK